MRFTGTSALTCAVTLAAALAAAPAPGDVRIVPVEGEGAKYWSRWRGPSGQGMVEGTGYPDRWSPSENVVWRAAVPGDGNSSPIVWGDRIFLTTARDGGAKLSLLCFRRSDGALLWETSAPTSGVEHAHEKNGHASATPVTDGRRVWASFGTHGLAAFDLDGRIVWHRDLGDLDNYHGSAGSPVLHDGRIYLYQDIRPTETLDSFVAAFDAETGATVWWQKREASVGWGTPVVIRTGDREELIVNSQRQVWAYDPKTGEPLWWARGTTREVIPTPVAGHGLIFSSSGRAGPTLAIRPGGSGDVTDTHIAWSMPKGSPFVPSPLLVGDVLYLVNDMQSIVTAYRATTGEVLFQGRLGVARREGFSASPVHVDGKVFFTNDEGETFVLRAGDQFELLHVNTLGARTLASPALVDGRWYFRTASELLAIGQRK